jgi:pilus assembly protein CpaE
VYPFKVVLIACPMPLATELQKELANQAIEVEYHFPDVKTVLSHLPMAPEAKRLFLMFVEAEETVKQVERLSDAFLGHPILAVLPVERNPRLLLDTMRAGATQLVTLPLEAADFKHALERLAKQYGYAATESKIIAVCGAREGCGTTSLAINLAYEISRRQQLTGILMEMSLQMGRLASYLDLKPKFTLQDLLTDIEHLDLNLVKQALLEVDRNLHVLCSPHQTITPLHTTRENLQRLVEMVRRLAHVVVLDMPYTFDENYFAVLGDVSHLILVADQTVPGIQSLTVVRDTLQRREINAEQFIVINRFNPSMKDLTKDYLCHYLQVPQIYTVANDYPAFSAAIESGQPLREKSPHSRALTDLDHLAEELLHRKPVEEGHPSLMQRLKGFFHPVHR